MGFLELCLIFIGSFFVVYGSMVLFSARGPFVSHW